MATRQEIDDFIREDETPLSEDCAPVSECEYCGRPLGETTDAAIIDGPEETIRLCAHCFSGGVGTVPPEEMLDWLGVRYWTGWACEAEPIARRWDEERRIKRRRGA